MSSTVNSNQIKYNPLQGNTSWKFNIDYNKHLMLACFVIQCCCPLFGGYALIYAIQAQVAAHASDYQSSEIFMKKSRRFSIIGIITGIIVLILFLALCMILAKIVMSTMLHHHGHGVVDTFLPPHSHQQIFKIKNQPQMID